MLLACLVLVPFLEYFEEVCDKETNATSILSSEKKDDRVGIVFSRHHHRRPRSRNRGLNHYWKSCGNTAVCCCWWRGRSGRPPPPPLVTCSGLFL